MSQVLTIDNRDYIPAGKVGKHFGYTRDYILMLARDGKIDGRKIGHRWYVNLESTKLYFENAEKARSKQKEIIREERKSELRAHAVVHTHARSTSGRMVEVIAILLIGIIIAGAGYVGVQGNTQYASALGSGESSSFFSRVAESLYNFFTGTRTTEITTSYKEISEESEETIKPEEEEVRVAEIPSTMEVKTVHTSLVIAPGEVMTSTTVESIRDAFSDDVSVSVDPHNPDTGIIVPHFKERDGEEYRFLIVPVSEASSP
jgi:CO dehydrogenase/acetyl-CoA synthase epsilon subunit